MHGKGCGPTAIHDHLRLCEPDYSGSLSAIKRMCRRLKAEAGPKEEDVAIRVETAPGEVAQVDFGYAGLRYDPERGVLRKCWVFVMTLGFSRDVFCDLVFDQKITTWLDLHVRAFEYFGGVPLVLIPDNLKAAVIRASFSVDGDPALNVSFRGGWVNDGFPRKLSGCRRHRARWASPTVSAQARASGGGERSASRRVLAA